MRADGHLCLVSAQPVPNLTPLLDPQFRPQAVVLVVSPDMAARARWLSDVLKPRGIRVETLAIADAWNLDTMQQAIEACLRRWQKAGKSLWLNATGGTKPMSIAAFQVFFNYDAPVFYVHPEKDRIIWLSPVRWPAHELANRIRLEPFLEALGRQVDSLERTGPPIKYRQLTKQLVTGIDQWEQPLGRLNWLAQQAHHDLYVPLQGHETQGVHELIRLFADQGLVKRNGHGLRFEDEDARFFVNGGWFEAHVFEQVRQLASEHTSIQDLAGNLQVRSPDGVKNEIDVAFLAENRLYLIECKTRVWKEEGTGNEALYRLDTLKDLLGGLSGRAMLASYRRLPRAVRRRARDLGIVCISGTEIRQLKQRIKEWIKPK